MLRYYIYLKHADFLASFPQKIHRARAGIPELQYFFYVA